MKQEAFTMSLLLDYYGALLTEKQKTYFDLYYNQDLSLGEIAEQEGISRQGVHDTISRTEAILRGMEEATGCLRQAEALRRLCAGQSPQILHSRVAVKRAVYLVLRPECK